MGECGILTIEVPPVAEAAAPVLVVKVKDDNVRKSILLGVFQRVADRTSSLTPGELHSAIQLGRIASRFPALAGLTKAGGETIVQPALTDAVHRALSDDAVAAGLAGHRRFYIQAYPATETEVVGLHKGYPDGLDFMLPRLPQIRPFGFGISVNETPEVIAGGGLRGRGEVHSLSVRRNGLVIYIVSAGNDGLAWASEKRRVPYSLNPLALVESTLEFARFFVQQVLPRCEPHPSAWHAIAGMADLDEDGEWTKLARVQGAHLPKDWQSPPVPSFEISPLTFHNGSPGTVAYAVLKEVYARFGIDKSTIPYVKDGEVSEESIRCVR